MIKGNLRSVARDFKQRKDKDSGETLASTVSGSSIRPLSPIVSECDLDFCNFDADQAFVQSELDEDSAIASGMW